MLKFAYRPPSSRPCDATAASGSRRPGDRRHVASTTSTDCPRERDASSLKTAQRARCVRKKFNGRRRCPPIGTADSPAVDHVVHRDVSCDSHTADAEGECILRAHSIEISGGQLPTGTQWNAFGRLTGHPPAAEKRRARKLGCVVGASDTIMFMNGYHRRNQPIDR